MRPAGQAARAARRRHISLARRLWLTGDWQYVRNPAYNADRGPVDFAGLRLHTEF